MIGFGKKQEPRRIENPFLVATRDKDPNGAVMVHIDPEQINSPEEVGLILADIANHFANALAMSGKADSSEAAVAKIRTLFEAEMESPTQAVEGGLVQ